MYQSLTSTVASVVLNVGHGTNFSVEEQTSIALFMGHNPLHFFASRRRTSKRWCNAGNKNSLKSLLSLPEDPGKITNFSSLSSRRKGSSSSSSPVVVVTVVVVAAIVPFAVILMLVSIMAAAAVIVAIADTHSLAASCFLVGLPPPLPGFGVYGFFFCCGFFTVSRFSFPFMTRTVTGFGGRDTDVNTTRFFESTDPKIYEMFTERFLFQCIIRPELRPRKSRFKEINLHSLKELDNIAAPKLVWVRMFVVK